MAVAFDAAGADFSDTTAAVNPVNYTNLTVGAGLTNSVLLVKILAQDAASPTSVVWDQGGTNQACTLISKLAGTNLNAGFSQYLYGRIAPTAGNKTLRTTWASAPGAFAVQAESWQGANQTSVAAAFTNVATGEGNFGSPANPTVTVTSAAGNGVSAFFFNQDQIDGTAINFSAVNNTSIFIDNAWYLGLGSSASNRASGAASVAMSGTITGGGAGQQGWLAQGVNIVAAAAAQLAPLLDTQNLIRRKRKIVSDNLTAPPQTITATVPTPSPFGYQTVDGQVKRKIRYLPEAFAFAPVAYVPTPSEFGYQTVDGQVKRKIRYLPEALAFAPAAPATVVPTPSDFGYQTVEGQVKRKIRYLPEALAFAPAAPAAAVPTPSDFGYQTVDGGVKRKIRYLPDAFAFAPVVYTTVLTPQMVEGQVKRKIRYLPEALALAPTAPAAAVPTPSDFGYQTEGGQARRNTRSISEAFAAFVFGGVSVVPAAAVQKDGDPDYWKLPWFNVEGGSFADTLRAKAITALEEAEDLAEQAEPAKAKRAARKAAKGLQEYVRASGALLSDDAVIALGRTAKQLNYVASQWDRSELIERVSNARMALLAYEAVQQDEEDALIALMVI